MTGVELDHVNLPTADLPLSRAFYYSVLRPFGFRIVKDFGPVAVGFGRRDYAVLALVPSADRVTPAHIAFRMHHRAEVDRFHGLALGTGGTSNGAPGLRPHYHRDYYAAFVKDPDGHNLEFVCHRPVG